MINIIAKCYSANCQLLISIDRFLPAVQRANFEVENTTYREEPGEEEEEEEEKVEVEEGEKEEKKFFLLRGEPHEDRSNIMKRRRSRRRNCYETKRTVS